ncbi:hypothetical protein NE237_017965 [Protea cynaroides]|uniref:Uncharacterized protein n=1 Tax=Protea cynaroides TaxID=273540 RepID=A0A9Q0K906_9MAGN|nr:hypothetical protein NE237_017965 [Protea cynaroides]
MKFGHVRCVRGQIFNHPNKVMEVEVINILCPMLALEVTPWFAVRNNKIPGKAITSCLLLIMNPTAAHLQATNLHRTSFHFIGSSALPLVTTEYLDPNFLCSSFPRNKD